MTIETNQLLKDTLKKNRPDLSESSIKTYLSNYNNISKGIKIVLVTQFDFVKYKDDILKYLDTLSLTQRKSKIAGIISLLSDKAEDKDYKDVIEEMRTVMNDAAREYDEKEVSQNSMSERQKLNYLSWPEIMAIYEKLKAHALPLLKIPIDKITNDVFEILQNYVLLSVYCLIPPRRVKDFALFKIRNIDTSEGSKDNYMTIEKKKPFFVFNTYKNAGRLGAQKVPITTELKKIIEMWIKINPTDWLIVSNKRTKIQLNRINTMLNNIFKRNLAPTLMRHAYLTHHFGNVNLADLEKTADQMGNSSITRILKYVDKEKAKEEGETKEV
jgi:integrase